MTSLVAVLTKTCGTLNDVRIFVSKFFSTLLKIKVIYAYEKKRINHVKEMKMCFSKKKQNFFLNSLAASLDIFTLFQLVTKMNIMSMERQTWLLASGRRARPFPAV